MEVQRGAYKRGASDHQNDESLLAATASELSAPLVLVRQLSLALAADNLDGAERQRLIDQLTLTSERALRAVRTLTYKPDTMPMALALEPVNAVTLCNEVVHELTPLFTAHGKSIAVHPRSKSPLMITDRALLRRLLIGFGDNALYYGSEKKPVELTVTTRGNTVRVGVRDYGPAIPSDLWQQLEGRIVRRASVPLPRRPHTSGVGLLMARQLAEAMGGLVGVTRHRDGATFYIDMRVSGQMSLL